MGEKDIDLMDFMPDLVVLGLACSDRGRHDECFADEFGET